MIDAGQFSPGKRIDAREVQERLLAAQATQALLRDRRSLLELEIKSLDSGPTNQDETDRSERGLDGVAESADAALDRSARFFELGQAIGEIERQIERINSEIVAMQIDLATRRDPIQHIAELSRAIGRERGIDITLRLIFARWWTMAEPSREQMWSRLAGGQSIVNAVEQLFAAAIPAEFGTYEVGAYEEFLGQSVATIAGIQSTDACETRLVLAETFESLLALSYERTRESGSWETPSAIADLLTRLACRPDSTVIDPACGTARALKTAGEHHPRCSLVGIEINPDIAGRAWMRLMLAGDRAEIQVGDAFELIRGKRGVDSVVLQPPWGLRLNESQETHVRKIISEENAPETFIRRDFPWLLVAYSALRQNGHAAVILPVNSLRQGNRGTHRFLIDCGAVEAIVRFPEGGLFPHTRIATALWLLRRPSDSEMDRRSPILMIDAGSTVTKLGAYAPSLDEDGVDTLCRIVARWREFGDIEAAPHVAVSVPPDSPQLSLGLDPSRFLAEPPLDQVHIPEPPGRLLQNLYIENFKSFRGRTRVPLAPLTVIFGANSAGKSTIIQSLLLLKQSIDHRYLVTQGDDVDVGGFTGIVNHDESSTNAELATADARALGLGIEYGTLNSWMPTDGVPDPSFLRTVEFRFADMQPIPGALVTTTLSFGPLVMGLRADHNDGQLHLDLTTAADVLDRLAARQNLLFSSVDRDLSIGSATLGSHSLAGTSLRRLRTVTDIPSHATSNPFGAAIADVALGWTGLLASSTIPMPRRAFANVSDYDKRIIQTYLEALGQLTGGVEHEVRQLLNSVVYLGPLRSPPQRFYNRTTASKHPGDGHHIAMYLFDHSNVVKSVNEWLNVLEVPYVLDVVPVRAKGAGALVGDLVALSLTDSRSGAVVTPADVGFGISQMLPIVVELLAHRESIICIEQPETHLHPRLQTRLADLLIESSRNGDLANQVIVETHSEHLMLRLQRRIREGAIDADDICILYVDQTKEGVATVKRLRINIDGEFLDQWPHGFFDERLDELFGT